MIRLLRRYLGAYKGQIAIVLVLLLVQALTQLYLPDLNAEIINQGVATGDSNLILNVGLVMVGVTIILAITSLVAVYYSARVAMGFGRDLRAAVFGKVGAFSQVEMNRFGTASLITRNTNDVQQVQLVVFMGLTIILLAPITGIGATIMAIRQDVPLSGLLLVILPIMFTFIALIFRQAIPLFRSMQTKVDRINQVMREALAGVRVIRAFVRVEHEEQRFDVASRDLFDTALRVNRLFAVTFPIMMAIFNISSVAVMWFGADRVGSGAMPIGNLTAFLTYLMQILMSVLMAVFMFILVPRAAVSADRINEILEIDPLIKDAPDPTPISLTGPGIRVELRNVEFRYPGAEQPVLRDVSFTAEPGRTTAIVGSTGSGKTTLVNLIPRFYDVTGGQVLVDGIDVRDVSREDLWKMLGVIPQQAFLFSGTIASNLRYGDADATAAELNHALDIAQARDFVGEMKDGLESVIDQGGTNVSGGQRQRLAIARALVKRAPLYVFDDSFSALDFRTDARLRATLRRELAGATVIIVAQRVGTILNADRIVVLDEGRVVGVGTHKELMESSETYREIVFSQLTPQEAQVA
ncbi:MAG TPA: ABC transporter ATP-binding protein [Candidatus Limnocylindrales bacterium]